MAVNGLSWESSSFRPGCYKKRQCVREPSRALYYAYSNPPLPSTIRVLGECVVNRSFSAWIGNTPACCSIQRISYRIKIPQNHPRSRTASPLTPHYSPIYCQISSHVSKFLQLMRNHKMPVCVTQQNAVRVSVHFKCKHVLQIVGYTN